VSVTLDARAWLMQKTAPLTVRYGRALRIAGSDLPRPTRLAVPTRHGQVRCDVYRPAAEEAVGTYVHFHGGAFIMRHPRMDDFFARYLAARAGVAVANVDYDTAPQVRYPVAQEEAHDVVAHLARHGEGSGLRVDRLAVGGFSAGGNLAASACLQARDRHSFRAAFQLLGVPSLDVAEEYDDKRPTGRSMLGPGLLELVRATYFPVPERRFEPYASPVRARDLRQLPPAMVITGGHDLLRREGDRYASRLEQAGVPVTHRVVPGADHYFLAPDNVEEELDLIARTMVAALRAA
jgi:acetyl esterase